MRILFAIVMFMIVAISPVNAQDIEFGAAKIFIGQDIGGVSYQLSKYNYRTYKLDADRSVWMVTKGVEPFDVIGTMQFKGSELVWVSKEWGSYRENKGMRSVIDAIYNASSSGETDVKIVKVQNRNPGEKTEQIKLIFPDRIIEVHTNINKDYGTLISVFETYGNYY